MKTMLVLIMLAFSGQIIAAKNIELDSTKKNFEKAFFEYQEHVNKGSKNELTPYIKALFDTGKLYLKRDDMDLAIIAHKYAAILTNRYSNKEAITIFREAIEIYNNVDPLPRERLINAHIDLARIYSNKSRYASKVKYELRAAIDLTEQLKDKSALADTHLNAGIIYISSPLLVKRSLVAAIDSLKAAHDLLKETSDERAVIAEFWLGKAYRRDRKTETAIGYFNNVLEKSNNSSTLNQLAMSSHAFLVEAYSANNEPEKATRHCQAIGEQQPWNLDQQIKPLYIKDPQYPRSAARAGQEGWVQVAFLVDTQGFAKDIKVLKHSGSNSFSEVSLKVMKKWRFAPKFVEGKPVEAKALYTMKFKLAK